MKFGALKNGSGCYAAQYNPATNRVEIIDTDPDLFTLMERHGYVSSDEQDWCDVLDEWHSLFSDFIQKVEAITGDSDQGWETVENVQELLSEEEKELLSKNGLHFNLPEGIGDAYDLRSQVQALIDEGKWID